jgi:hypothetical protein
MIYIAKTIYPVYGGISRHRHTTGDTGSSTPRKICTLATSCLTSVLRIAAAFRYLYPFVPTVPASVATATIEAAKERGSAMALRLS